MAGKRQRKNGVWEYQFERKGLLPRTYRTFDDEKVGDTYAANIEALLDKGVVPTEMLNEKLNTVENLLDMYEACEVLAHSSASLLPVLRTTIGGDKLSGITNDWLDRWIEIMQATLSPSTIKKRVELLARCVDWGMRKNLLAMSANPMRLLPRGWATKGVSRYVDWSGQRDRRLSADQTEERAIRKVLVDKNERLLFDMALESAMRLREMYTLTVDQVDMKQDTIFLDKTKNGDKRQVPMSSVLKKLLEEHLAQLEGDKVFPWWNGELKTTYLNGLTNRLSQKFARRFAKVGHGDLHFHDLRHEATSRIYERTKLSDLEVASITGHKDLRMLKRYANLRGSNLAKKLW